MPGGWEQNSCAPGPFFKENKCSFIFHLCPFNRRAVSIVGAIGFIGLIGPHIAKPIVGEDARKSPIISKSIKEFRLGSFSFINRLNNCILFACPTNRPAVHSRELRGFGLASQG